MLRLPEQADVGLDLSLLTCDLGFEHLDFLRRKRLTLFDLCRPLLRHRGGDVVVGDEDFVRREVGRRLLLGLGAADACRRCHFILCEEDCVTLDGRSLVLCLERR